ncbi:MAG: glycoside hydrolase family 20 zincin-like fold domain-containing protein, partial [Victivallaceae bacterium]|nr:glycoside hydrolase family 20 zincin-like fold domain-containing protein [Victivallaceae bacterium]
MFKSITVNLIVCLFSVTVFGVNPGDAELNIIPTPKRMTLLEGQFSLSPQHTIIVVDAGAGKEFLFAAEYINKRIKELGGTPLRIKKYADLSAEEKQKSNLIITGENIPAVFKNKNVDCAKLKPEGYSIASFADNNRKIYLLAGKDARGVLYSAVTFSELIRKDGSEIYALSAGITDWPDCKYRALYLGARKTEKIIEWVFKYKVNQIHISPRGKDHFEPRDAKVINDLKNINEFAHRLGIETIANLFITGLCTVSIGEKQPEFRNWKCQILYNNIFMCWSADELIRKRAEKVARYLQRTGFDGVVFHFRDGSPNEHYGNHCPQCEKRFGDNRAAADANYINITYKALKKLIPSIKIIFVTEPYYGNLDIPQNCGFKKYYQTLGSLIPEDVYLVNTSWDRVSQESWKKVLRQPILQWRNLPMNPDHIGRYFSSNIGFAIKSGYFPQSEDISLPMSLVGFDPSEVLALASCELMWNINSPGNIMLHADTNAKPYRMVENLYAYPIKVDNMDYDKWLWYKSTIEPKAIIDDLLPKLCEKVYGKPAAGMMCEILKFGVARKSLINAAFANSLRPGMGSYGLPDDPEVLLDQYSKARKAYKMLVEFKQRGGKFKNNSMGFSWLDSFISIMETSMIAAKSDYHILLAKQCLDKGDIQKAKENLKAAQENLKVNKVNYKHIEQAVKALSFKILVAGMSKAKAGKGIKAAIYNPNDNGGTVYGENVIYRTLIETGNTNPVFIPSLDNLSQYDCVIIPDCKKFGKEDGKSHFDIEKEVFQAETKLRNYVINDGGGVIFYHDSVGFFRFPLGRSVFPELCIETKRIEGRKLKAVLKHPVSRDIVPEKYEELMYYDHIAMTKGDGGEVIF